MKKAYIGTDTHKEQNMIAVALAGRGDPELYGKAPADLNAFVQILQQVLEKCPHSGALFAFRGKRGDLVKLLWYDGQGLCLFSKRMDRGRFVWPITKAGKVSLTAAQLSMLLEGIDWRRPERTAAPLLAG